MSTFFLFIPRLIQAIVLKNEILSCGHGSVSGTAFMRCQVAKLNPTLRLKPEKKLKNENQKIFFFVKAQKGPYGNTEIKPPKMQIFYNWKKGHYTS